MVVMEKWMVTGTGLKKYFDIDNENWKVSDDGNDDNDNDYTGACFF